MIRWQPGPKKLGCIYHQRGVQPLAGESLVVDVFIMPRIARRRRIVVTIGRYRNYHAVVKVEWQLRHPDDSVGAGPELSALFEKVGAPPKVATDLASDVQRFIAREGISLKKVLASLSKPAA